MYFDLEVRDRFESAHLRDGKASPEGARVCCAHGTGDRGCRVAEPAAASGGDVLAPGFHGVAAPGEEVGSGVGGFGGIRDGVGEAGFGDFAGDAGFAAAVAEAAAEAVGDCVDAVFAEEFAHCGVGDFLPVGAGEDELGAVGEVPCGGEHLQRCGGEGDAVGAAVLGALGGDGPQGGVCVDSRPSVHRVRRRCGQL